MGIENSDLTRAKIREKYNIVRLEPPAIANRILSAQEAAEYESAVLRTIKNFETYWEEDDSGDID